MKKSLLSLLFFITLSIGFSQDIESILDSIDNISYTELVSDDEGYRLFELYIHQPLDHNTPQLGTFEQRIYLHHKHFKLPVIMCTEGYEVFDVRLYEPTELLGCNQIDIEYRYYGESIPKKGKKYEYLHSIQASKDLHIIKEVFGKIYQNSWVNFGISKGGITALQHRFYFPDDVAATLAYVAPLMNDENDTHTNKFFDTVGTFDQREGIKTFQLQLLKERDQIARLISNSGLYTFNKWNAQKAIEFTALEFPFLFWQYGLEFDNIPKKNATVKEIADYLVLNNIPAAFSDKWLDKFEPFYYQCKNEYGYYSYATSPFKNELEFISSDSSVSAAIIVEDLKTEFNNNHIIETIKWLENEGNEIIYFYGSKDPWSACQVNPSPTTNAIKYMIPGASHMDANIENLTSSQRQKVLSTLCQWLKEKR